MQEYRVLINTSVPVQQPNITPAKVNLASHTTPPNVTFGIAETIAILKYQFHLFFLSDLTKTIKVNPLKVYTTRQHIRSF